MDTDLHENLLLDDMHLVLLKMLYFVILTFLPFLACSCHFFVKLYLVHTVLCFNESNVKTCVLNTTKVLEFVVQLHYRPAVVIFFKPSLFLVTCDRLTNDYGYFCLCTGVRT